MLWHVRKMTWHLHASCCLLHGHETELYGVKVMQGAYVKLQSTILGLWHLQPTCMAHRSRLLLQLLALQAGHTLILRVANVKRLSYFKHPQGELTVLAPSVDVPL